MYKVRKMASDKRLITYVIIQLISGVIFKKYIFFINSRVVPIYESIQLYIYFRYKKMLFAIENDL